MTSAMTLVLGVGLSLGLCYVAIVRVQRQRTQKRRSLDTADSDARGWSDGGIHNCGSGHSAIDSMGNPIGGGASDSAGDSAGGDGGSD